MGLFRARGVILSVLVKLCRGTLARSQRYSQVRGIHEMPGAVRPITGLPALTFPTSASQSAAFSASLSARPTQRRVEAASQCKHTAECSGDVVSYTPRTLALPPTPPIPTPPLSSMRTQPQNGANLRQRRTSLPSPPLSLSLSVFCLRRCLHYLGQVGREKSTVFGILVSPF